MVRLTDFFRRFIEKFIKNIEKSVMSNFEKGSVRVINMSNKKHLKPIPPTNQEKEMLSGQITENIKGVTDDMEKQIKNSIRNSILNQESNKETAQRLDAIFKGKNATTINYKARLDMIAKTETARILNTSSMKTAKRIGFTHKYIDIIRDDKTADDSRLMWKKYGGPEKAIPIDEDFVIVFNGKEQRGQFPPLRPRDRELVFFTMKEDKE